MVVGDVDMSGSFCTLFIYRGSAWHGIGFDSLGFGFARRAYPLLFFRGSDGGFGFGAGSDILAFPLA